MPERIYPDNFTWSRGPVDGFRKGLHNISRFNDPTYLGFVLLFDWYTPETQSWHGGSPLLAGSIEGNSAAEDPQGWKTTEGTALHYLKSIGEYNRMRYLNQFITTLKAINYNMPWYWQELEGLDAAWQNHGFEDPYKGGDDSKITIKCLESIDMIMTSLMSLYNKACFDKTHRRIIIPENLRKFTVYIYVQEIRKFQVDALLNDNATNINNSAGSGVNDNPNGAGQSNDLYSRNGNDGLKLINENSAHVLYALEYCEFLPDESNTAFATLNMSSSEAATQTLAFSWENIHINAEFPNIPFDVVNQSGNVGSDASSSWKDKVASRKDAFRDLAEDAKNDLKNILEAGQNVHGSLAERLARDIADRAEGYARGLLLGNVHGFSSGDIQSALAQGSIQGLSAEIGQAVSSVVQTQPDSLSGTDNVHSPLPVNSPNPLSGDENVFN